MNLRVVPNARYSRWLAALIASCLLAWVAPAQAAELVVAELDVVQNTVTVTQGQTATFTITLTSDGTARCDSSANISIHTVYTVSSAGVADSSSLTSAGSFAYTDGGPTNCSAVPASRTVTSSVTAAATTPVGTYTLSVGAPGRVQITNLNNSTGNDLKDNTATTLTFNVVAASNAAPVIGTAAADASGSEGSLLSTGGVFTDSNGDSLTVTKASGAGSVTQGAGGAWSWSLTPSDQGSGTVVVQASDGRGGSVSDSFDWSAVNVVPVRTVAASGATGVEGDTVHTSGAFTDVAGDMPLTIAIVDGPGTLVPHADGTWSWSLATSDEVSDTVTVRASDGDGGSTDDTFAVEVANVAPGVQVDAQDVSGNEGSTLSNGGAFSDLDQLVISKTSGPGQVTDNHDRSWSWSYGTTDDEVSTVVVGANDGDGGARTDSFGVTVNNVAPVVVTAANDASGLEGTTLAASGSFTDVAADLLTITKLSGAGTVVGNGNGTWSWSLPVGDNGSGSVTVRASDGDGGVTTDTFDWTASNSAPTVSQAAQPATGTEGNTLATQGAFTDVPADTLTVTLQAGSVGNLVDHHDGTWSWSLPTNDNVNGSVTVIATDDDGSTVTNTFSYSASNEAPTIGALGVTGGTGTACMTGNTVQLAFSVSDPGSADTIAGTIAWGDGQSQAFTGRNVTVSHTYAAGDYTITVSASDDDGSPATAKTGSVQRNYRVSAILPPFNADGSSVFKAGSTVPVKVQVTDCLGLQVGGLAPTIRVIQVSAATPGTPINEVPESTSAADTTGFLRWDGVSQYIYNMATKSLPDPNAKYKVTVALGSATAEVGFGLRSK
jgi:hypothetical protein